MTNAVYPKWKEALLQGTSNTDLDGSGTTGVFLAMIDVGYTYSATHDFYDDVGSGTRVGTDGEIGGTKSFANGTFDGADVTFTSVSGDEVTQLIIYRKNSGAESTWCLVLFLNASVTGLPVTPNSGDITVQWNASGIFTLSDADAKADITEVGAVGPVKLYTYRYRGESQIRLGLIAQQVENVVPDAVRKIDGFKRVDYHKALSEAERLAA